MTAQHEMIEATVERYTAAVEDLRRARIAPVNDVLAAQHGMIRDAREAATMSEATEACRRMEWSRAHILKDLAVAGHPFRILVPPQTVPAITYPSIEGPAIHSESQRRIVIAETKLLQKCKDVTLTHLEDHLANGPAGEDATSAEDRATAAENWRHFVAEANHGTVKGDLARRVFD